MRQFILEHLVKLGFSMMFGLKLQGDVQWRYGYKVGRSLGDFPIHFFEIVEIFMNKPLASSYK